METCTHCQALTADIDFCDRCDEPACDRCLERPSECLVAPRRRLEELEHFLADSDNITLAALKKLAMRHAWVEMLLETGVLHGGRAAGLLFEATTDMTTLDNLKEGARQIAVEEREELLVKLRGREG